jgi:hypothetical protein
LRGEPRFDTVLETVGLTNGGYGEALEYFMTV